MKIISQPPAEAAAEFTLTVTDASASEQTIIPLGRAVSVLENVDKAGFRRAVVECDPSGAVPLSQKHAVARRAFLSLDAHLSTQGCSEDFVVPVVERVRSRFLS